MIVSETLLSPNASTVVSSLTPKIAGVERTLTAGSSEKKSRMFAHPYRKCRLGSTLHHLIILTIEDLIRRFKAIEKNIWRFTLRKNIGKNSQ
jgi:hypothetical protein